MCEVPTNVADNDLTILLVTPGRILVIEWKSTAMVSGGLANAHSIVLFSVRLNMICTIGNQSKEGN